MKSESPLLASLILFCLVSICSLGGWSQEKSREVPWRFAVSGDSRNCGDVVMPAIAASVLRHDVEFYWHLGDFRLGYGIDEDMIARYGSGLTLADYIRDEWGDFIAHQIVPFGPIPVYLGRGNHELPHKTNEEYIAQFAYWLDTPELRQQRAADTPAPDSLTYFHWHMHHVEFITLDNAPEIGFSDVQLRWLEGVLAKAKANSDIFAVVVGMHRALPNSLACAHSMNGDIDTPADLASRSLDSGRRAYEDLWKWHQQTGKRVYILASHSHFFMERIFETPYWKDRVLPGWIVGTAGARRYPLPSGLPKDIRAETGVAGYLLGKVQTDGKIKFEFQPVTQTDVPKPVNREFKSEFVQACFQENKASGPPPLPPATCSETAPSPK